MVTGCDPGRRLRPCSQVATLLTALGTVCTGVTVPQVWVGRSGDGESCGWVELWVSIEVSDPQHPPLRWFVRSSLPVCVGHRGPVDPHAAKEVTIFKPPKSSCNGCHEMLS